MHPDPTPVLDDARLRGGLDDADGYRQHLYRDLARNDDPLLREIGEQLYDGLIRPRDLLTEPTYRDVVERGLERLRQADPETVRTELTDYVDALRQNSVDDR